MLAARAPTPSPGTASVLKHMLQRWGESRDGMALLGLWGVLGTGITLHALRSRQQRRVAQRAAQKLARTDAADGATDGGASAGAASSSAQGGGSIDAGAAAAKAKAAVAAAKAAKRASRSRVARLLRVAFGLGNRTATQNTGTDAENDAAAATTTGTAAAAAAATSSDDSPDCGGRQAHGARAHGGSSSSSSSASRAPLGYAACLSTGLVLRLVVSMRVSRQIGVLGRLLGTRDWGALFDGQLTYMAWCIPAAALNAFVGFATDRLALALRRNLLAALTPRYCAHALAAKNALDDPEQRLADDAALFAKESAALSVSLFKPLVEVAITSRALGQMMGYAQMAQFYGYFALAASWVRFVGPSVKRHVTDEREADGAFRARHARLAEFAEEVAVLRGGPAEARALLRSFEELEAKAHEAQAERLAMDSLNAYAVRYGGILAAFVTMLPAVLRATPPTEDERRAVAAGAACPMGFGTDPAADGIDVGPSGGPAGGTPIGGASTYTSSSSASAAAALSDAGGVTEYFLTCLHLLVNVGMAMRDLVMSHKTIGTLSGLAQRLDDLEQAVAAAESRRLLLPPALRAKAAHGEPAVVRDGAPSVEVVVAASGAPDAAIVLEDVDITAPGGTVLVRSLTLRVHASAAHSVMVHGPSGAGKTAMLRTLLGLWHTQSGSLACPAASECFFVPQRPYVPPGTLREQLLYPGDADDENEMQFSDAALLEALRTVRLPHLASSAAELYHTGASEGLSGGEAQRLGLARLLLRKPRFALLDECTNNCDEDFESWFFQHITKELDVAIVSITHKPSLQRFHPFSLRLDGTGAWELTEAGTR